MGNTWDCPNFIHTDNADVLIINPTGIKPHGKMYLNKYISGGFVGKLDYNTGKFKQSGPFGLLDYGFDFYVPQTVKTPDGRYVVIGWLGMPDSKLHEESEKWAGLMTLPREIKIVNGKIVTSPIEELKNLRGEKISLTEITLNCEKDFFNIIDDSYEIEATIAMVKAASFFVQLRESNIHETVLHVD